MNGASSMMNYQYAIRCTLYAIFSIFHAVSCTLNAIFFHAIRCTLYAIFFHAIRYTLHASRSVRTSAHKKTFLCKTNPISPDFAPKMAIWKKNKPKQSQFKANSNPIRTQSNPKQTQSNPIFYTFFPTGDWLF